MDELLEKHYPRDCYDKSEKTFPLNLKRYVQKTIGGIPCTTEMSYKLSEFVSRLIPDIKGCHPAPLRRQQQQADDCK